MKTKKLLKKYFPDYKDKGLSEPIYCLEDKVTPLNEDNPGIVVDIDTTETLRPPKAPIEWTYLVHHPGDSVKRYFASELKLREDESIK